MLRRLNFIGFLEPWPTCSHLPPTTAVVKVRLRVTVVCRRRVVGRHSWLPVSVSPHHLNAQAPWQARGCPGK